MDFETEVKTVFMFTLQKLILRARAYFMSKMWFHACLLTLRFVTHFFINHIEDENKKGWQEHIKKAELRKEQNEPRTLRGRQKPQLIASLIGPWPKFREEKFQ